MGGGEEVVESDMLPPPPLDRDALIRCDSIEEAARLGRTIADAHDAAYQWDEFAIPRGPPAGNPNHRAPEAGEAPGRATLRLKKQGAYEAGILLQEIIRDSHPPAISASIPFTPASCKIDLEDAGVVGCGIRGDFPYDSA